MFEHADTVRPGSRVILEAKALKLMGGADSPAPPAGQDVFPWNEREGHADLFIAYCSGGRSFQDQLSGGTFMALPAGLAIGADYGLAVVAQNNPAAGRLALFILSLDGQSILRTNGFVAPLATR